AVSRAPRRAAATRTQRQMRARRRGDRCSRRHPNPVTSEELTAERAEKDQALEDADEPVRKVRPLQGEAGILQTTEQKRDQQHGERVVARERGHDDAGVAVVRLGQATRIELMAKVAVLARAAEAGA